MSRIDQDFSRSPITGTNAIPGHGKPPEPNISKSRHNTSGTVIDMPINTVINGIIASASKGLQLVRLTASSSLKTCGLATKAMACEEMGLVNNANTHLSDRGGNNLLR